MQHFNNFGPRARTVVDAAFCSVAFTKLAPPTSSQRQHFFLRVVGEVSFHSIAVERALLVEQDRRGRAEACAQ
jgi:hypothetical protein